MRPEVSAQLSQAVDAMPAFPHSVRKLLALTRQVNTAPQHLIDVISQDPVLTVKVLRSVNSAYFGLPKPVASIQYAVVYLGFKAIESMALSLTALDMVPRDQGAGFDRQRFLIHALSTATVAKQLAERLDDGQPMDCFMAGLLHNFGAMVLAQHQPHQWAQALHLAQTLPAPLVSVLREIFGADQAQVGALLLEKWGFPSSLVDILLYQNTPDLHDSRTMACVFAAKQISLQLQLDFAGTAQAEELPPTVAKRLGGSLQQVMASLGDLAALENKVLFLMES